MASANVKTETKVVEITVEETKYVLELTRDEAIVLLGQLGAGNVIAHGQNWRNGVYYVLNDALQLTPQEDRLRGAHRLIDDTFRRSGYSAARSVARAHGITTA